MEPITVYSSRISNRLVYILDWLFVDVFHSGYIITSQNEDVKNLPFFISYGESFENSVSIPDCGLLRESNIQQQKFDVGFYKNVPTLFHNEQQFSLPFDLFSAVFFLISRYEEYDDFIPDKHGRYPSSESILYKNNWLERPLVDEWIFSFFSLLKEKNFPVSLADFSFLPTYDIDIAYSFLHKGFIRTGGALIKDLVSGNFKNITDRIRVLQHKKTDPFDSFNWLLNLHKASNLPAIYFMLVALKVSDFDKNNSPLSTAMQQLIKDINSKATIGIHPSYYSNQQPIFESEKNLLEKTTGKKITKSRQHYVKMKLPETYHFLLDQNINDDYSMGYGSALGFRAGTGRSFNWYDLKNETETALKIHPFCFMDSTAHFEQKLSATASFEKLEKMKTLLSKTGSQLITVFHNFSLGTDMQWKGWKENYEHFLLNR